MPKYMLLFMNDKDSWESFPQADRDAAYKTIGEWWAKHSQAGTIVGGDELQHPRTAKTVRPKDGKMTVSDGPYIEAKELISGFCMVETKDQNEAVEIAKTWPGHSIVEVRPIVEQR